VPGGALSPGYDISPTRSTRVTFLKPARVIFSLDLVNQDAVPNENLLRLYTIDPNDTGGEWRPLANSFVDRVRNEVSGEVEHLSPFVVLRTDRLPDGGYPYEMDGGVKEDSGVIVIPPIPDAGRDAGRPDAGRLDAGPPDAGVDAGIDAGYDAGIDAGYDAGIDAGYDAGIDAGHDAGIDAGYDAGFDAGLDAGVDTDAGFDAGADAGLDAGGADAGDDAGFDAGEPDAGDGG
jgi:hypothetical protein